MNKAISTPIAIIIIIVLAILVGGIVIWQYLDMPEKEIASEDETDDRKVYRNESMKFEVKYPKDWKIQEQALSVDFLKVFLENSNKLSCGFKVSMVSLEFFEQMLEVHKYMEAEDWERQEIALNGIPTTKISYPKLPITAYFFLEREVFEKDTQEKNILEKGPEEGVKVYYLILYDANKIKVDDKGHEISVEQHFFNSECIETFNQMLSTFRFID